MYTDTVDGVDASGYKHLLIFIYLFHFLQLPYIFSVMLLLKIVQFLFISFMSHEKKNVEILHSTFLDVYSDWGKLKKKKKIYFVQNSIIRGGTH